MDKIAELEAEWKHASDMKVIVVEARPQTGKWRGTVLSPGDSINMDDLGRTYTLPDNPRCYFCLRRFKDGDRTYVWVRATQELSNIHHEECRVDEDGFVHSDA